MPKYPLMHRTLEQCFGFEHHSRTDCFTSLKLSLGVETVSSPLSYLAMGLSSSCWPRLSFAMAALEEPGSEALVRGTQTKKNEANPIPQESYWPGSPGPHGSRRVQKTSGVETQECKRDIVWIVVWIEVPSALGPDPPVLSFVRPVSGSLDLHL